MSEANDAEYLNNKQRSNEDKKDIYGLCSTSTAWFVLPDASFSLPPTRSLLLSPFHSTFPFIQNFPAFALTLKH